MHSIVNAVRFAGAPSAGGVARLCERVNACLGRTPMGDKLPRSISDHGTGTRLVNRPQHVALFGIGSFLGTKASANIWLWLTLLDKWPTTQGNVLPPGVRGAAMSVYHSSRQSRAAPPACSAVHCSAYGIVLHRRLESLCSLSALTTLICGSAAAAADEGDGAARPHVARDRAASLSGGPYPAHKTGTFKMNSGPARRFRR